MQENEWAGSFSLPLAVEYQLPAPTLSQTTAQVPNPLVSELWNEEESLWPLTWLSCPQALPLHATNCSPSPGQLLPACCVDSWFSRPVGIPKTNEMEASARQAWGQQDWQLRSKSSRAWHPPASSPRALQDWQVQQGSGRMSRCLVLDLLEQLPQTSARELPRVG